ncbi:MAG: cell division protein FtsH, partial [Candidatus Moranbacteria bacterium]|nr:cell division protein FtsH [Candidatus Moranbacteria bacterium]
AGGYTMAVPTEDKMLHSRGYFLDEIAVLLSGFVTEQAIFGDVTTGASNDLERATNMARNMVTRYGMSSLGPRTFGKKEELIFLGKEMNEEKNYSEKTAQDIDHEVSTLIEGARKRALKLITEKRDKLDKLANTLIEKETIEKEEFDEIVGLTKKKEKTPIEAEKKKEKK